MGHVQGVRVDGPGGPDGVDVPERQLDDLVILLPVGQGVILRLPGVLHREVAVHHAQGLEDAGPDEVLPRHPRDLAGQVARRQEHEIVVLEERPEIGPGLEIAHPVKKLLPGEVRSQPDIVVPGQTRTMAEQVPGRHLLRGEIVLERERGQISLDPLVPIQLSLVHHDPHGRGREGLGRRADGEDRPRGDREAVPTSLRP